MSSKLCKNVVPNIFLRQIDGCKDQRQSLKIFRNIAFQDCYTYRQTWEKHSKQHIATEGSRIYFENYRLCYYGCGHSCKPRQQYKLPTVPTANKIEDALVCQIQPDNILPNQLECRGSLITVSADKWLRRYDLESGKLISDLYLSTRFNFRDIGWNEQNESFVLRSTHTRTTSLDRQAGISVSVVMVVAVFEVFPFRFVGMMEISKKVFGNDVIDATISHGLLITMHQSGYVKVHSFDRIVEEHRLYEVDILEKIPGTDDVCGQFPDGLPVNIQVSGTLPVLLCVRCQDHDVKIGGFPWHYMICPFGELGHFKVYSLETHRVIQNGHIYTDELAVEPDRTVFHGDASGRIIHIGGSEIRVLNIQQESSKDENGDIICNIHTSFKMSVGRRDSMEINNRWQPTFTSSGRAVKKKMSYDEITESCDLTIHDVDYENELDVLYTSTVYHGSDLYCYVCFFDNNNGTLLKKVRLEQPSCEYYEHRVYVDLDTLIQTVKTGPGKFSCYVYKLFRSSDTEPSANKASEKYSRNPQQRRSARVQR